MPNVTAKPCQRCFMFQSFIDLPNTRLGVGLGCENYHEMAEPVAHEHQLVKCLVAHEERLNPKKTIPLVPQVTGPFKGHFTSAGCVLN